MTLVDVDGEQFEVELDPARPGHYQFSWLSGRNAGYGFATATSDGSPLDRRQVELAIRTFLAQVHPDSGYPT